jgi:hypothetical protein
MAKEEWGTKRVCPTTGKRFYDLNRVPVVSPYTGEVVNLETARQSRVLISDKADRNKVRAEEDDLLLDDEEDIDEAATDVELDDDLLEDDEDDNVSLDDIADVPGGDEEP